jgi:hypothetical protein
MQLTFEVIPVIELEIGDIFYCTPDEEMNEFGEDYTLTGTDQIFIKDDYYEEDDDDNHAILVNGGWHIWFKPGDKVVRLGKYNDFIRIINMVKQGHPDMELGPNDNIGAIHDFLEVHPEYNVDLLAALKNKRDNEDGEIKKLLENLDKDEDEDEDEDDSNKDDDELPF